MSRLPSDATQLRHAKSELRKLRTRVQRAECMESLEKQRAEAAEKERDEWKARFDQLLQITKQADEWRKPP